MNEYTKELEYLEDMLSQANFDSPDYQELIDSRNYVKALWQEEEEEEEEKRLKAEQHNVED